MPLGSNPADSGSKSVSTEPHVRDAGGLCGFDMGQACSPPHLCALYDERCRDRPAHPDAPATCHAYFLEELPVGAALPFWEGAAAIVLGFSFFGFLDSRLPRCSPFAIVDRSCSRSSVERCAARMKGELASPRRAYAETSVGLRSMRYASPARSRRPGRGVDLHLSPLHKLQMAPISTLSTFGRTIGPYRPELGSGARSDFHPDLDEPSRQTVFSRGLLLTYILP